MFDELITFVKNIPSHKEISLWWRDDDAVKVTPKLNELYSIQKRVQIPLHMAVIPELCESPFHIPKNVFVLQHGIRHENHAAIGEKKCEFPSHLNPLSLRNQLLENKKKLQSFFPNAFLSCFVPPWNRCYEGFLNIFDEENYSVFSTFASQFMDLSFSNMQVINTHIDIIDWSNRKFIGPDLLTKRFIDIVNNHIDTHSPIGILTHHLCHDAETNKMLSEFLYILNKINKIKFLSLETFT